MSRKPLFPRLNVAVSGRRYYNPSQGRFVGRDTAQEAGGLNLYGFCGNNAINCWDVQGDVPYTISGKLYDVTPVPAQLWNSSALAKLPAGTMFTATPIKWGVSVQVFYSTATGFGYTYSPFSYYYVAVPIARAKARKRHRMHLR